jgi:pimeloyl-ACP methyl ester carboxylesterase
LNVIANALSAWSPPLLPPVHRHFVADDGLKLHYLDWPADPGAPVIAMIHGRLAHAHWFDPAIPFLSPRYHCVALDLRGHGDSESSKPISIHRVAADIAEFCDLFRGRRLILVGHSYGGGITALAQPLHGIRPALYVMADTLIHWDPSEHRKRRPNPSPPKRYASRDEILGRFRLLPGGSSAPPETLRYIAEHSVRQLEDGTWTWRFDEEAVAHPPDGRLLKGEDVPLEQIAAPSLLVHGELSIVMSKIEVEKVARRMPNAEAVMIPGAHHHITLDRPREFASALTSFFSRHGL